MKRHLQKELSNLKRRIVSLGALAEERLRMTITALESRDGELARQIIESDKDIDQAEVEVEEECLKIIALHQPVAVDLRFINIVIKINNDLERVGDEAVNIAERDMGSVVADIRGKVQTLAMPPRHAVPHGYASVVPARQAYSHSASVGRR